MAIIEGDELFVILVNEEDHFRIQVIRPGFQIMEAYKSADRIDDYLNEIVPFAFSDDIGYLTACPSNAGTGLKISVMMHLPLAAMSKKLSDVIPVLNEKGLNIKGIGGGDVETIGNIFIISNHVSLGISEVDIIDCIDESVFVLCFEVC